MKRKVVNLLLTKITAILLVASMTVSIIMSSDKNCALFNAIAHVFADEIDDPANEGEYSENDADTIDSGDTEVSDITDTVEGDDTVEPENTEGITAEPSETESNTEDNETGLVYRQVKAEGEDDLYVSGLMPEDIRVTAESVEVEVSGAYVIAAYDIKVFDVNGNEWQPEQPLTISVAPDSMNAKSEDETQVIYVPDELAESGNPVDIDDKSIEKIDAVIEDGNVVFEAEHFSVYVIIEHEGGDVVTPRVEFHFISPVGETYQPTVTGGIAYYTSTPYVFNNKADEAGAGNHQVTSIVRDGDKLESIEAPMNTQNTYFYGWYAVDLSSENVTFNTSSQTFSGNITYSWPNEDPLRVELDKTVSVSAARDSSNNITSVTWTIGSVSGTSTDVDASGCAHVYLAPIYSNYYFVNFHLGARGETTAETLLSRKLIVLGNSNLTHVKISDVQAPSNDPVHVVFIGWEENTGTEQNPVWSLFRTIDSDNNEIVQPGMDGTYIEVGPKTVDLYPFFVQARYINFNIGASGNGALYLGPQLMFTSDEAAGDEYALTSLPTTTRAGYTFAGWYTGADGTGTQITDASGNIRNISYSETGSYTGVNGITYSGISYKIENGKIYAYNALDELTLYAKWTPNITATYKVVIWKQRSSDAAGITDANKTYDYETYFYDNAWNTSNPVTENTLRSFSGYDASGNTVGPRNLLDMTFTGFKAGRYDYVGDVNPQGSTVINVYYDRITFNLKFIFARRQLSNGSETGNFLVPVLNNRFNPPSTITWQAYCTQGTGINWDSANTTVLSQVCSYPANRIESADYNGYRYYFYVITANYDSLIASEWPDYNNFPTVGANNANRRLSGWWLMATADLYGSPGQNDTVKGVVSTMDELILGDPDSPDGNFLIASYRTSTPNNWTYNIYMETLSGVDYSGQTTVTRNNKTYYLADSFVARSSNTDLSQQNAPAYSGFEDGERVSGGTLTANFYYTRKSYNLTFSANYPLALAGNAPAAQVFTNISYDQSLASYSSTAAPATPSNDYYFDGWYEDASGTVPFDFAHETMPSANKIVYAKWSLVEYQINIDPNGGIVDSIDYSWFTSHNTLDVTGLSGTNNGYATYYDNEATQLIEPYNNLVRPYVEVSEAEAASMPAGTVYRYVYVYRSNQEGGTGKLGAAARTAVYIKDTEESLSAFYDYYCEQVRLRQARDPQLTALPRAQWEATYVSTEKSVRIHHLISRSPLNTRRPL